MLDSELHNKESDSDGPGRNGSPGVSETPSTGGGAAQARSAAADGSSPELQHAPAGGSETARRPARRTRRTATGPAPEAPDAGAAAGENRDTRAAAEFAFPFATTPAGSGGEQATEHTADDQPAPVPAAAFQPPQVIFQPPSAVTSATVAGAPAAPASQSAAPTGTETETEHDGGEAEGPSRKRRRRGARARGRGSEGEAAAEGAAAPEADGAADGAARSRKQPPASEAEVTGAGEGATPEAGAGEENGEAGTAASRRRRRKRRRGSGPDAEQSGPDDPPDTVVHVRPPRAGPDEREVQSVRGSTRLEAKRQRRKEGRESGRRRPPIITESEFLARREAVDRLMVVRQQGERIQIAVLEDGVLVEHYVDRATHQSMVGNVYLGKVQNVLPSMEAAFVDIGKGRNAVLYAGEVNFDASGLEGESKRIESALKSGQSVLVQVTKDPVGHKGARLTSQVSLPGRYLVYVPGGSMMGISRKLPDTERARLKQILKQVMPENAGVIVRTAAEGASEDELAHDVSRLSAQWESIDRRSQTASPPELLYSEPDLTIRVVRDIFNEDFSKLVVSGEQGWDLVDEYVRYVAPHLAGRLEHWQSAEDAFGQYRIDEQLAKALERKVWLPSGGSVVIDTTEAMTVIDVNTGKFTGQGGNLEETVTRNNLEAAEEIVRQLRVRDTGGIIVIDFIDMVLESNRELVLRRLLECLSRDRTKHQVAEVTSLGLVQMTRKRVGSGLLEAFSQPCECCNGRGVLISLDGADHVSAGHRGRADVRAQAGGRASKAGASREGNVSNEGKAPGPAQPARPGGDLPEPAEDAQAPHSTGGRRRRRAATREPGPPSPPTDSVAAGETGARDESTAGPQADGRDGTGDHGDSASAPAASGF